MSLKLSRPDVATFETRQDSLWDFLEIFHPKGRWAHDVVRPGYSENTAIRLQRGNLTIHLAVSGRLPKRARRTLVYILFAQLRPLLTNLNFSANVSHSDSHLSTWMRDFLLRPMSFHQVTKTETSPQRFGSLLRLTRNMHGLTQHEVAQELEITRIHLSRIEHGRRVMRGATYARAQRWLDARTHH